MPNQPINNEKKSIGPLVAVIIILTLIIIGGLYFLKLRSSQNNFAPKDPVPVTDQITNSLMRQGNSDDLDSIERDLNNSNFENLDQGAAIIQAEFVN